MGDINDRRLWTFLGRFADLSAATQALIFGGAFVLAAVGGIVSAVASNPLLSLGTAVVSFPAGAAVGVLVLHPVGSAWLMRRQCGYETTDLEISARFDGSSRRPSEWVQRRTIKARVDGIRELPVIYRYGTGTNDVQVTVAAGGTLHNITQRPGGPNVALVRFPKDLRAGELHELELRKVVPATAAESLPHLTVCPTHPTRRARLRITFGTERPTGVWVSYWLSSDAIEECHVRLLHPDASGVVEHDFHRLKPGHRYGLTWEWPDPSGGESS